MSTAERTLLILYPRDFRDEYGALLVQAFRDRSRHDTVEGSMGWVWFWFEIVIDLIRSAASVRKGTPMTRSRFIRDAASAAKLAGGLIVVGTIWSIAVLMAVDSAWNRYLAIRYTMAGWFVIAGLLLVVSVAGIFLRFRGRLGIVGKIGSVLVVVGLPFTVFYGVGLLLVVPGLLLLVIAALITRTIPYQPVVIAAVALGASFVVAAQGSPETPVWALPLGVGAGAAWYWLGRTISEQDSQAAM